MTLKKNNKKIQDAIQENLPPPPLLPVINSFFTNNLFNINLLGSITNLDRNTSSCEKTY